MCSLTRKTEELGDFVQGVCVQVFSSNVTGLLKLVREELLIPPFLSHLRRVRVVENPGKSRLSFVETSTSQEKVLEVFLKVESDEVTFSPRLKTAFKNSGVSACYCVPIPAQVPRTREEYNRAKEHWPMDFNGRNRKRKFEEGGCSHFLRTKNRKCGFPIISPGSSFCTVHKPEERMPCPINPKHTVAKSRLAKHLLVCPDRRKDGSPLPYYSLNINSTVARGNFSSDSVAQPRNKESAYAVINLVKKMLEQPEAKRFLPLRLNILKPAGCGVFFAEKHNHKMPLQNASISGHVNRVFGSEQGGITCVEVGAGKGFLALNICKVMAKANHFILVDNRHFRNKADARLREQGAIIERQYIDLKDWALERTPSLGQTGSHCGNHVVLVGKHVCGVATCYSLRSCEQHRAISRQKKLSGIVIATCCHHSIIWDDYVNQEYFIRNGFTRSHFEELSRMSSWAVSTFRKKSDSSSDSTIYNRHGKKPSESGSSDDEHEVSPLKDELDSMSFSRKRELGNACKNLIDIGRALYLEKKGYDVELLQYVDSSTSRENRLLVARSST